MPFELPPPSGPPPTYREPAAAERIHPLIGLLRWEPHEWRGVLPATGGKIFLSPEPESPDEFPACWDTWLRHVDRDLSWLTPLLARKLKELAGYGWPVFPFQPKLSLADFWTNHFTLYLETPGLEAPHVIEVHFDERMKMSSAGIAG